MDTHQGLDEGRKIVGDFCRLEAEPDYNYCCVC